VPSTNLTAIEKLYYSLWVGLGKMLDECSDERDDVANDIDPIRFALYESLPAACMTTRVANRDFAAANAAMLKEADKTTERLKAVCLAMNNLAEMTDKLKATAHTYPGGVLVHHREWTDFCLAFAAYKAVE
jgi:hypothetical protein